MRILRIRIPNTVLQGQSWITPSPKGVTRVAQHQPIKYQDFKWKNSTQCDDSISFVETQTRTGGTKYQSEFSHESKEEFCGRESEYV
jgi:hypothetical protein